jgi:hypothetical protein
VRVVFSSFAVALFSLTDAIILLIEVMSQLQPITITTSITWTPDLFVPLPEHERIRVYIIEQEALVWHAQGKQLLQHY